MTNMWYNYLGLVFIFISSNKLITDVTSGVFVTLAVLGMGLWMLKEYQPNE